MKDKYWLLFKTGDAELRAIEHTVTNPSKILPIIELTRGRITRNDKVGLIEKRFKKLNLIFKNQPVCIDITTSDDLTNQEIKDLFVPNNGYINWVNFLQSVQDNYSFREVIPTIILDTEDTQLKENLLLQVSALTQKFKRIAYRNNITDDGYWDDLGVIRDTLNISSAHLYFILDCEYVPSGAVHRVVDLIKARIQNVNKLIEKVTFIVISTSFPRYVSDIGHDQTDVFPLSEIDIYEEVKSSNDVLYGDYGSINPNRNDTITMARGWIPRIDTPTVRGIYYYRERKKQPYDYAKTYTIVARKVYNDSRFPHYLSNNWGVKQIIACKDGYAPGSSPSFWISVRLSIYIDMQLKRLGY